MANRMCAQRENVIVIPAWMYDCHPRVILAGIQNFSLPIIKNSLNAPVYCDLPRNLQFRSLDSRQVHAGMTNISPINLSYISVQYIPML